MEMGRRLVLVGIFVLIERGSIMQLVIGTAFCAIYLLLKMQVGPYKETSDDCLANGSSFALLMVFLCCIIFKVGTLTELENVQHIMSREQESDFYIPTLPLTIVLSASIIGTLVASFVVLSVQLVRERERMAREARAAKMRRLRYRADGSEVDVPPITKGVPTFFHIFLSHVWGYACRPRTLRAVAHSRLSSDIDASRRQDGTGPDAHRQAAAEGDDA